MPVLIASHLNRSTANFRGVEYIVIKSQMVTTGLHWTHSGGNTPRSQRLESRFFLGLFYHCVFRAARPFPLYPQKASAFPLYPQKASAVIPRIFVVPRTDRLTGEILRMLIVGFIHIRAAGGPPLRAHRQSLVERHSGTI